jgi:hypothetical protein
MSNTNTGGPAFPCEWDYIGSKREAANGMTLRDYFAAKAMQSFTADVGWKSDQQWFEEIAEGAYRQADAMLKAREA